MKRKIFAPGIELSELGLGCASLTLHDSRSRAVSLLEHAFELGITHFDVARLYGFGQAESILGEFLRGRRDRVTVATKFGLTPSPMIAHQQRLVEIARWVSHRIPAVAALARKSAGVAVKRGTFSPNDAEESLCASLRALGTDYIDIFLLHEATMQDARRNDLLAYLDGQVSEGRIRCYGLASDFAKLGGDASVIPAQHAVLQFDSNVMKPNIGRFANTSGRGLITFGSIAGAAELARVAATTSLAQRHRAAVGVDLTKRSEIARLMLTTTVVQNPQGVVLFGTSTQDHLRSNVEQINQGHAPEQLQAFECFVDEAYATLAQSF